MKYSYNEVIDIIQNTRRFGSLTGYDVSKRMLEQLGNPQSGIPFVHVAGTNGKGSTTAFLCKILEQTGKKVGMFTSPHLITFEERIRINGVYIPKEDVTRVGNQLLEMNFDVPPTMFDYCLAMAVLYFKEQQCDIMVMETGIGGRYDSTNALGIPEVAVITKIGFDHTAILGETLEEIAGEKAGIIKEGCPVVISNQEPVTLNVLRERFCQVNHLEYPDWCRTKQVWESDAEKLDIEEVDIKEIGIREADNREVDNKEIGIREADSKEIDNGEKDCKDVTAMYVTSKEDYRFVESISMKMQTGYQIENAATALLAAKVLLDKWAKQRALENLADADVSEASDSKAYIEKCIRTGIADTFWKGRMEIINEDPFFMIDGAHNAHGVLALAKSLQELYTNEKFHFIMGVMADKDYEEMIDALLPLALDFITVTPESNRALQSKELAECIQKKGIKARYAEDMEAVIRPLLPQKEACQNTTVLSKDSGENHIYLPCAEHKIIAFGSLYFIGAIETMLEENSK